MTIKARNSVLNPNYLRFYRFDSFVSRHCENCPAKTGSDDWASAPSTSFGAPVHTNWSEDRHEITTIYICESPSDKETSHNIPSVGKTGQGIYKAEIGELTEGWLDVIDEYLYRTNIVRCQADAGLQKWVDTTLKNKRVRQAFVFCLRHLKRELIKIFWSCQSNNIINLKIVLAIGSAFPNQEKETKRLITSINRHFSNVEVNVSTMDHPSS